MTSTGPICFDFFLFSRQTRKNGFPVKPYVEEIFAVTAIVLWDAVYVSIARGCLHFIHNIFYDILKITMVGGGP